MFFKQYLHAGLFCLLTTFILFVTILPVLAQDQSTSRSLIGLSLVDANEVGDTLLNDQLDKLAVKFFTQLDENSDNSIDLSEFKSWDADIKSINQATANLFKNITAQQIFEATDIDANSKLTINEVKALYYFDFISKDVNEDKILMKDEILSQAPVILRLVSKDCKSINTMYNGMLMGGFCGK